MNYEQSETKVDKYNLISKLESEGLTREAWYLRNIVSSDTPGHPSGLIYILVISKNIETLLT